MHKKRAALEKLARALGMFREHVVLDGKLRGVVPSVHYYPGQATQSPAPPKTVGGKETKAIKVL